ncbi:MAG: hypothetical protein K9G11_04485 [Rickettsiaceae bacterium]|nr:hypothetical protein [Rickettsiaceae bacterium]
MAYNPKDAVNKKLELAKAQFENSALNITATVSMLHQKNDGTLNPTEAAYVNTKVVLTNGTKITTHSITASLSENFVTKERTLDGYFDYTLTDNSTEFQNKACSIGGFRTNTTSNINFVCNFNAFDKDVQTVTRTQNKALGLSDELVIEAGDDLDVQFNMSYTSQNSGPFNSPKTLTDFIKNNTNLISLSESLKHSFKWSTTEYISTNHTNNSSEVVETSNSDLLDLINFKNIPMFRENDLQPKLKGEFVAFKYDYDSDENTLSDISALGCEAPEAAAAA